MNMSEYTEFVNLRFNNFNQDMLLFFVQDFKNVFCTWKLPFKNFLVNNMVRQRVVREANNLNLYSDLIDQLDDDELEEIMLPELVTVCKEFLENTDASAVNKDALRNLGTFLGLITIVRNKSIPEEHISFRPLLENAISSKSEARLVMAIVFVTHVFKYCPFSLIFRQNCTWVSRIIDVLNTIHSNSSNNLHISLEIERFSDGLKKMNGDEETLDMYLKRTKSAQYGSMYHQTQFIAQQYQHTIVETLPMPHLSVMELQHQLLNNQMQNCHISLNNSYYGEPMMQQNHYNQSMIQQQSQMFKQNVDYMDQKGDFCSQYSGTFLSTAANSYQMTPTENENVLALIVRHLKFDDVPMFNKTPYSRNYVSRAFAGIIGKVEENFFDRVKDLLLATCEAFLFRDMAFCNSLQQLNLTYKQAIQAHFIALLMPSESMEVVFSDLYDLLSVTFSEIVQTELMLHGSEEENEKYVRDNAVAFVQKNQGIVTDSLCTLMDRRSTKLAMQSARHCLNEGMMSNKFSVYSSELQQINYLLPAKLQRLDHSLNRDELQVYKYFEEFSEKCQKYMESVDLQSLSKPELLEESDNKRAPNIELSFDLRQQLAHLLEDEGWSESDLEVSTPSLTDIDTADLKDYIKALQSKNPNKKPAFFSEYVRLVLQPQFLDRLMGGAELTSEESRDYLILLVLPVLQLVDRLTKQGKLSDVDDQFNSELITLFTTLTEKYPQVFDAKYLTFSEAIPDTLLSLRNIIMNCTPADIELPSISLDLQQVFTLPQMKVDLDMSDEDFCDKLPEDLKDLVDLRMKYSKDANFVAKVVSILQESSQAYDRTKLLYFIVYVAHLAIKMIHKSNLLVVERVTLANNQGQTILIKILEALNGDGRYVVLTMMVDQLRYPNCMTAYFMCFLLNLFQSTKKSEIREMLFGVLIERFLPSPPYPWGLRVVMKELIRNPMFKLKWYDFARCSQEIVDFIGHTEAIIDHLG